MKALKIVGIVVLGLWLAYLTWRVEYSIRIAHGACVDANLALKQSTKPGNDILFFCPSN